MADTSLRDELIAKIKALRTAAVNTRSSRTSTKWFWATVVLTLVLAACIPISGALPTSTPTPSLTAAMSRFPSPIPPTPESTLPPEFRALKDTASGWEVDVIEPSGANIRRISPQGIPARYPHFSPDGHWLAFARVDDMPALMLYDRRSGEIQATAVAQAVGTFAWAGDSRHLALISGNWDTDNGTLITYDLETGDIRPILDWDGVITSLSWSHDQRQLAFIGSHEKAKTMASDRKWEVYIVRVDGSGLQQVTDSEGQGYNVAWSPADDRLLYQEGDRIMMSRPSQPGTPPDTVAEFRYTPARVMWSRDAQQIAATGVLQTLLIEVETRAIRHIRGIPTGAYIAHGWSPNGERIVFQGSCCGVHAIFFTDLTANDGSPHQIIDYRIVSTHFNQLDPEWAPDADLIAFSGIWEPLGP